MSKSPLDEKTLADLRATLGDDFLPELIAAYLEETPLLIKDLQQALAEGNAQAFTRPAHSIKSSSSSLGDLETIGKSGDLSQVAVKLTEFIGTYPEVEQSLKNLL